LSLVSYLSIGFKRYRWRTISNNWSIVYLVLKTYIPISFSVCSRVCIVDISYEYTNCDGKIPCWCLPFGSPIVAVLNLAQLDYKYPFVVIGYCCTLLFYNYFITFVNEFHICYSFNQPFLPYTFNGSWYLIIFPMTWLQVITITITLIGTLLVLGSLGIIVLELINFAQNIFYDYVF
jgi:hypothetical protein